MARFLKKREQSNGKSPGSLIFIGSRKMETAQIRLIDYAPDSLTDQVLTDIREATPFRDTDSVSWININGVHDTGVMTETGDVFGIHPLVLEDIMNTGQRPKIEDFESIIFCVVKMIRMEPETGIVTNEQLSLILGDTFLITFQEQPGDVFEPVRERLRRNKSRLRASGPDYLAYALLDTVVDNYIHIIERIGERIEDLEEEILEGHDATIMERINLYMRELNYLRKAIRPAKEAVFQLSRLESDLIAEETRPFLKDLMDLSTQAAEAIDTYRDLLSDQLSIYNSVIANRMNDIMRVLTVFAAIFIPMTFIAGVYGTNFDYLPELHFRYSYFIFWGVMIVVAGVLTFYFKKKRWL